MTFDQLTVERAAWAVALIPELRQAGFQFREHFNEHQNILTVTAQDAPGWSGKVTICSAHRLRNRFEVNGVMIGQSNKPSTLRKIVDVLKAHVVAYRKRMKMTKETEHEAAQWLERQEKELAEFKEVPGVDVEIIKSGPHAGKYAVRFLPGNPLEHLSLAQFRKLYVTLCCLTNPKA